MITPNAIMDTSLFFGRIRMVRDVRDVIVM
jgi:hypothetical protein